MLISGKSPLRMYSRSSGSTLKWGMSEAGNAELLQQLGHVLRRHAEVLRDERRGSPAASCIIRSSASPSSQFCCAYSSGSSGRGMKCGSRPAATLLRLGQRRARRIRRCVAVPRESRKCGKSRARGRCGWNEKPGNWSPRCAVSTRQILRLVRLPVVERDAPVLAPAPHEFARGEERLRRRAAAPIEIEKLALAPDVRAVAAHAERDVADQLDVPSRRPSAHPGPLPPGDPLHVGGELPVAHQLVLVGARGQPRLGLLQVLMLRRPLLPERVVAVLVQQRAEERVAGQPAMLASTKAWKS